MQFVRDIYRMLISEKLSVYAIARELSRKSVEYIDASQWDYRAVYAILTSPKYVGSHVFGRTPAGSPLQL